MGIVPLLYIVSFSWCLCAQSDSLLTTAQFDSIPKATFFFPKSPQSFYLNKFSSQKDSCIHLEICYDTPYGIKVFFSSNDTKIWNMDTVIVSDNTLQNTMVKTSTSNNAEGKTQEYKFYFINIADSLQHKLNIQRTGDVPKLPSDSMLPNSSYTLNRYVFLCVDKKVIYQEARSFIHPSGYMIREPRQNYPERYIFHCGKIIKMPTDESIRLRGNAVVYWHLSTPPPLEYNTPMKEIREVMEKPKNTKKGFFNVKPIP